MKPIPHFKSIIGLASVLALGACADMNTTSSSSTYPQSTESRRIFSEYGVVQAIDLVRPDSTGIGGSGIGAGAIAGALVGGILGNQVGAGSGNTAATVIGAAGGAYAGHALENRNRPQPDTYRFTIRMQDGSYQTVTQTSPADIRVGDRVKIENGLAQRY